MKKIKLYFLLSFLSILAFNRSEAQCPLPGGLSVVSLSGTSSKLNWNAVPGVSVYNVEVEDGQNNNTVFHLQVNTTTNTYTVNSLTPGLVYKFKVRTRCTNGDKSDWSAWFSFAAGGGAVNCGPLQGLAVTGITSNSATFTWNPSPGGLGYAVRVEDASGNPVNFFFTANTTTNSYHITGLNTSSHYKVKVRKRCGPGSNGSWSPWMFFRTTSLRLGNEESNNASVSVYPNPATDFIQVKINESVQSVTSISIYDMEGRLLKSENTNSEPEDHVYNISTSDLNSGIYILNLQTDKGIVTNKFSINR